MIACFDCFEHTASGPRAGLIPYMEIKVNNLKTIKTVRKTQLLYKKFAGPAARGVSDPVFELFQVDFFDNFSLPEAQVGEIRCVG